MICRVELDFYKVVLVILPVFKLDTQTVFTSVNCTLVNIASFHFVTDFIKTEIGMKMFITGKCDGRV